MLQGASTNQSEAASLGGHCCELLIIMYINPLMSVAGKPQLPLSLPFPHIILLVRPISNSLHCPFEVGLLFSAPAQAFLYMQLPAAFHRPIFQMPVRTKQSITVYSTKYMGIHLEGGNISCLITRRPLWMKNYCKELWQEEK